MNLINRSSDKELLDLGRKLGLTSFIVCSKPDLKKNMKKYDNIIFNLSDDRYGGTHWVCLFKPKKFYFDSFAQDMPSVVPKDYKCASTIKEIQAIDGQNCGQLCILWLYYMNFRSNDEYYSLFKDLY